MELLELRNEIDRIDNELVRLFGQRMEISARIAQYKKAHDLPVFVPEREAQKLADMAQKAEPDLAEYTQQLYRLLFELSKNYQKKLNDK